MLTMDLKTELYLRREIESFYHEIKAAQIALASINDPNSDRAVNLRGMIECCREAIAIRKNKLAED